MDLAALNMSRRMVFAVLSPEGLVGLLLQSALLTLLFLTLVSFCSRLAAQTELGRRAVHSLGLCCFFAVGDSR
jgi:hypothetical protein